MATYYYSSLFKKSDVRITQGYSTSHRALDLSRGVVKQPIYSPNKLGAGTVSKVATTYTSGGTLYKNTLVVWVRYDNGMTMRLYHGEVGDKVVSVGQRVQVGQQIYRTGNTGHSFGDHLHVSIHNSSGLAVNPTGWVINDNIPVASFKVGDNIVFTGVQNIRTGAGDKFKISGQSTVGLKATIIDGSRSSQNEQFKLGANDNYTWWDIKISGGGTGWVADVGKFKVDTVTTPSPQDPVIPSEPVDCQKQIDTLKAQLDVSDEALGTAQADVLRLSDQLGLMRVERDEYKKQLDDMTVEKNTWENKYNALKKEMDEMVAGRETWIQRMGDALHKLFGMGK